MPLPDKSNKTVTCPVDTSSFPNSSCIHSIIFETLMCMTKSIKIQNSQFRMLNIQGIHISSGIDDPEFM